MNGESKLKVLRAVVALKRFTVTEVMGWTGLDRSQVNPQIARLLGEDQFIEYDRDYAEGPDAPRPAHRPIRHYRLSQESANRQKAFAEIRAARAALGEDPSAQRLAVIQGRLDEMGRLFTGLRGKGIAVGREQSAEYEVLLQGIGDALDQAILELEVEDESLRDGIAKLRGLHQKLSSELSELALYPAVAPSHRLVGAERKAAEAWVRKGEMEGRKKELGKTPLQRSVKEMQLTLEGLKSALREVMWERSAILGPPVQKADWPDVFVLMPFTRALRPVYEEHIKAVVSEMGLRVGRADEFSGTGPVMKDIWSAIHEARIVVADCTGRNPNVFYQIGLAHAIGRQTILISQSPTDVPFDLSQSRIITYENTPPGMKAFEKALAGSITKSGELNSARARFRASTASTSGHKTPRKRAAPPTEPE